MISNTFFVHKTLEIIGLYKSTTKRNQCFYIKSSFCFTFPLWLLVSSILDAFYIFENIKMIITDKDKFFISFVISIISSLLSYCILVHKKRNIQSLLCFIQKRKLTNRSKKFNFLNILQVSNVALFLVRPFMVFFLMGSSIQYSLESRIFEIIVKCSIDFYQVHFPLYITLIYASFCSLSSAQLKAIQRGIKHINVFKEKSRIFNMFQFYRTILTFNKSVENIFSGSVLFLIAALFVNSFLCMKDIVTNIVSGFKLFHSSLNFVTSVMTMTILITFASEIPKTITDIKNSLCELYEEIALYGKEESFNEVKLLIDTFIRRETFSFSALNMVYFRRSLVIASYGTLISYGLLIISYR